MYLYCTLERDVVDDHSNAYPNPGGRECLHLEASQREFIDSQQVCRDPGESGLTRRSPGGTGLELSRDLV